jgi:folate-binding protein YgfZ
LKQALAKAAFPPHIFSAMAAPSFCLLPHRSVVAVSGPDRVEFLQGLISNDATKVTPGHAVWAALLTPQGRFLNDMFVADGRGETLLLETERERAAGLARKLSLYKLRSRVTVEDRATTMEVAIVLGARADKILAIEGLTAFVDPRLPELGLRVLAPAGQTARLLGLPQSTVDAYESLRLRLGVPDGSRDLPVEKALLLESGFDELHGIDWDKGCYMGQELTARTKYRGLVRKRLFPVKVNGPLPAPGAAVQLDGRDVGEVRSGAGDRAIAMLRIEAARGMLIADKARLVAEIPDWMRLTEEPAG